jgi:hypothetical protein
VPALVVTTLFKLAPFTVLMFSEVFTLIAQTLTQVAVMAERTTPFKELLLTQSATLKALVAIKVAPIELHASL